MPDYLLKNQDKRDLSQDKVAMVGHACRCDDTVENVDMPVDNPDTNATTGADFVPDVPVIDFCR